MNEFLNDVTALAGPGRKFLLSNQTARPGRMMTRAHDYPKQVWNNRLRNSLFDVSTSLVLQIVRGTAQLLVWWNFR